MHDAIHANKIFCVNMLALGQEEISNCFSGRASPKVLPFDFTTGEWQPGSTGAPILHGAAAAFDCVLHSTCVVGSHTVFFGRVVDALHDIDGPLIYGQHTYGRPVPNPA
jgi:flavin reductase